MKHITRSGRTSVLAGLLVAAAVLLSVSALRAQEETLSIEVPEEILALADKVMRIVEVKPGTASQEELSRRLEELRPHLLPGSYAELLLQMAPQLYGKGHELEVDYKIASWQEKGELGRLVAKGQARYRDPVDPTNIKEKEASIVLVFKKSEEAWKLATLHFPGLEIPLFPGKETRLAGEEEPSDEGIEQTANSVTLVDMADTHFNEPGAPEALRKAVAYINERLAADLVIVAGDIGPQVECKAVLDELKFPCHVIPGDNDGSRYDSVFPTEHDVSYGGWRFLGLDVRTSGVPDSGTVRLEELQEKLDADSTSPTVIFMHVQAIPPILTNSEEFLGLIDGYENVRLVLCGHLHTELKFERDGVVHYTAPALHVPPAYAFAVFRLSGSSISYHLVSMDAGGEYGAGAKQVLWRAPAKAGVPDDE